MMSVRIEKWAKIEIVHFHQSIHSNDCIYQEIVKGTVQGTLPYSASKHQQNRYRVGQKGENW
jgi:hypothetical protein